jgi:hypothetical protein
LDTWGGTWTDPVVSWTKVVEVWTDAVASWTVDFRKLLISIINKLFSTGLNLLVLFLTYIEPMACVAT